MRRISIIVAIEGSFSYNLKKIWDWRDVDSSKCEQENSFFDINANFA